VQAVIDSQNHDVDVKIIMSRSEKVGYLEQLQSMGLDVVNNVRIQTNVPTKGPSSTARRCSSAARPGLPTARFTTETPA
jgi:hypothetical protein